jgi:DNA-binding NarL/FixJ family response regulator
MKTESEGVVNVIIADDHMLYRTAIIAALSFKKDVKIIAQADNGSHLLNLLTGIHPDVILLDIQMPVMDGIATLQEVKKMYPDIKIVMLTMLNDHRMVTKLTELGADGYLSKTCDSEIIYNTIKSCYDKQFFFNPVPGEGSSNNPTHTITPFRKPWIEDIILSEKEISVLRLMCEEKTTPEIADAVNLSAATVETIKERLKTKTGAKTTAGLIMFAVHHKLLDEPT